MALLKIARMGHPVLLARAEPVADPTTAVMRRLVSDMIETMDDAKGVGLAAPQIYQSLRLLVWRYPKENPAVVLFNPEIASYGNEEPFFEACLSIPGLKGEVHRPTRVSFTGLDASGAPVSGVTDDKFVARILQHENDHLNGVLYPTIMRDLSRFAYIDEYEEYLKLSPPADSSHVDGQSQPSAEPRT
ncbi:MAG: peptide deformylase [Rubritepida sp.]|nr:peptide deformylase [Rubritepida sp.]